MDQVLERIKERVAQRDSPIRTVKGLVGAIGMSEAGFYTMLKRGTTKQGTLLAMADALKVDPSYLSGNLDENNSESKSNEDVLHAIFHDVQEMRQVFEDQLKAKDRQIDGLQRMLESVLGKFKGVIEKPLTVEEKRFAREMLNYKASVQKQGFDIEIALNDSELGSLVGGTPFSHAENTVRIAN